MFSPISFFRGHPTWPEAISKIMSRVFDHGDVLFLPKGNVDYWMAFLTDEER